MCGRYSVSVSKDKLRERFGFKESHLELKPRYNLAPAQMAPVVVDEGQRTLRMMKWGLIPYWAKDPSIGTDLINARAETLAEKASFKKPFLKQRCLIPADGFYEWRKSGKIKTALRFVLKNGEPFAFAGLWDLWGKPNTEGIRSFTIITTSSNGLLGFHQRMPAILSRENEEAWLDPRFQDMAKLSGMLKPYPEEAMDSFEVSPAVNSAFNDGPECAQRAPTLL